ncbi:C40 family peptidase [Streptantibioticus rubrisoli]|uniref:NlpC/P60 family protein n=1 Tax=Streptantibioticus rubrisoli TaxID=1387313 RepID=A0ABT1P5D9_9ACTN|nr:NlpC/P60 family protein [Streptantibioticus rubrisoli]MCQ4040586.1 NlpC/P60 family protein [Streptantibioticus rubrisoli]
MSAPTIPSVLLSRVAATVALATAALTATIVAPGLTQQASANPVSIRALKIAASKQGSPYRWGATGPYSFDCSGLTSYAFRKAGRILPRTAAAQYHRTRHISASARRPGDLVFFHHGGYVYHVGVYAGHNRIWHAPRTGTRVRLERIWTRHVWYGRVR